MAKAGMKVKYESNTKKVKSTMTDLERMALRASGKVIRKAFRKNIPKDSGDTRKSIGTWIRRDRGLMQVGVYNRKTARKKNKPYSGFFYHILEFGSRFVRPLSPLRRAVMENIPEIIAAQSEFLPYLSDEAKALAAIRDIEEVEDA